MFTVSLIGPDGVGKTTIVNRLQKTLPMPVKYIYMGDNVESCNYILPSSRWWKKRMLAKKKSNSAASSNSESNTNLEIKNQDSKTGGVLRVFKKTIGFTNRILDLWYRYLVAFYFSHRGYVVLFDRHFTYDYYHFDIESQNGQRPFKRRLHGFLLKHTIPDPDLVICLDAPAEVIFKRKGEFTIDYLESRRSQYKSLQSVINNFAIVDANRDLETVIQEVNQIICNFDKQN